MEAQQNNPASQALQSIVNFISPKKQAKQQSRKRSISGSKSSSRSSRSRSSSSGSIRRRMRISRKQPRMPPRSSLVRHSRTPAKPR